jgi:ferredoxin-NADP reductase
MAYKYTVTKVAFTTPTTMVVSLYTATPRHVMPYEPGQYATLAFMRNGRRTPVRCFSITSSPKDGSRLQFALRIKGKYTQAAARHIREGNKVWVDGPFGGFIFKPAVHNPVVFLAGGIGITPFLSMIRCATDLELSNDIVLIYGCPDQNDVVFADELMALEKQNPHVKVVFAIGHGGMERFVGHRAVAGRVRAELLDSMLAGKYQYQTFFICGPPSYRDSMERTLKARGVSQKKIHTESFSQVPIESRSKLAEPSHIYILTALSTLLLMSAILGRDVTNIKSKAVANDGTTLLPNGGQIGTTGSRGDTLNQAINNLQGTSGTNGGSSNGQAVTPVYNSDGTGVLVGLQDHLLREGAARALRVAQPVRLAHRPPLIQRQHPG